MRGSCALLTIEKISIGTASDPDDQSELAYNLDKSVLLHNCLDRLHRFLTYETKCQWFGQKHLTLN